MTNNESTERKDNNHRIREWFHSSSFICALLVFITFLIILAVYLCVCTPRKYDLRVGSISHVTVDATKDVVDEVTTEEKRAAAADTVVPTYRFQQGVKEEVLASLADVFQELRTIQQYGLTLRPADEDTRPASRPFSEEEIDYADFLSALGDEKIEEFDSTHFKIRLTYDDMIRIIGSKEEK